VLCDAWPGQCDARPTVSGVDVVIRAVGSVWSSHQTVSFRHLEKLVLPSIFDKSFILDDVKLEELSKFQRQF